MPSRQPGYIECRGYMCRLFGMSGGQHEVQATFWLLDAPTSLIAL